MSAAGKGYLNPWERGREARGAIRCGVYLRVSLDATGDGLAVDRQREICTRDAQRRGWQVVDEYVDNSISASDEAAYRPGFERMMSDLKAGRIDAVVAYDLDRLTRQMEQLERLLRLADSEVGFIATANGEYDLTTDNGRMMARIRLSVAAQEVERKGRRQRDALRQRAKAGRWPKGGVRPFGYTGAGEVVEAEAAVVRALFNAVERGVALRVLARVLNGEDAPTADAPGVVRTPGHMHTVTRERNARRVLEGRDEVELPAEDTWTGSTITGMLRNPKYAGLSTYTPVTKKEGADGVMRRRIVSGSRGAGRVDSIVRDSEGVPVLGDWVAIVDMSQFFRVQDVLNAADRKTNRSGTTGLKHLGSGLYRCGECGEPMYHHSVGAGVAGYRCKACGLTRSGADDVDAYVLQVVCALLAREDVVRRVRAGDDARRERVSAEAYRQAVEELEVRRARAVDDYARGLIDADTLAATQDVIRDELGALKRPEAAVGGALDALGVDDPLAAFEAAGAHTRRRVVGALVHVELMRRGRGARGFDPATVRVTGLGDE